MYGCMHAHASIHPVQGYKDSYFCIPVHGAARSTPYKVYIVSLDARTVYCVWCCLDRPVSPPWCVVLDGWHPPCRKNKDV